MTRSVIITGASSGIGEATARRLATDGWQVTVAARRTDRLDRLVKEIENEGGQARAATVDVTDRAQVARLVEDTAAAHGRVDAFVANAGVMPLSRLDARLVDEWDRMIDVNVRGLLHGIDAVLPHFGRQRSGHFVTIASIGAHQVSPTAAVYCGTKYAARAITEGLRQECDPSIRVTTVSPGVTESELAESISDPDAAALMTGYRRHAVPASAVAAAIAYALDQPEDVDVNEIVVRPTRQR
jgi:NADP-dependent 3-hydroxy acid dehydrogenase YdfG